MAGRWSQRPTRSRVSRPVPAPTSIIRGTCGGSHSRMPGWRGSAAMSRSYRSGSSRERSAQANAGLRCGSAMVPARKRPDSSAEKTPRSAVEYRCIRGMAVTEVTSVVIAAFHPDLLRFVDPHGAQRTLGKMRPQPCPEGERQGFRGRNPAAQPLDIRVQVAVIDMLDDLRGHQVRQPLQVHHVAGGRVDGAADDHFDDVIVPVQTDAFAVEAAVLLLAQSRVAQLVRGVESLPTADAHM